LLSQKDPRAAREFPSLGADIGAAVSTIHAASIEIIEAFVLGPDADDCSVFPRTVEFAERRNLVAARVAVLTPLPGTAMRRQLAREGRIPDHGWSHCTMSRVAPRSESCLGKRACHRNPEPRPHLVALRS